MIYLIKFPFNSRNLKNLKIDLSEVVLYEEAIVNCQKLESLSIWTHYDDIPQNYLNAIRIILQSNKKLKTFKTACSSLFIDEFPFEMGFALTKFEVCWWFNQKHRTRQNINLFLKTQRNTLEIVKFGKWMGVEIMKTILLMPCLKEFILSQLEIDPLEQTPERFPQSHSITSLELPRFENPNAVINKMFLKAFPKVETLNITSMPCEELSDLIPEAFRSLKKVKFDLIYQETSPKTFSHVEILETPDLNDEVAASIPEAFKSLKKLTVHFFEAKNISNKEFFLNLEEFSCSHVYSSSLELFKVFEDKNLKKDWEIAKITYHIQQKTISFKVLNILALIAVSYLLYYFYFSDMTRNLKQLFEKFEEGCWIESWNVNLTTILSTDTFIGDYLNSANVMHHVLAFISLLFMFYFSCIASIRLISDFDYNYNLFREITSEFDYSCDSLYEIISELYTHFWPFTFNFEDFYDVYYEEDLQARNFRE